MSGTRGLTELRTKGDRAAPMTGLEEMEAFILDMDGVVTNTARVHALAWKQTFDHYLQHRAEERGEPFVPFDERDDYLTYVDGKPRYDGVRDFLASRHISIPFGEPNDGPDKETVCGIGNAKNRLFLQLLEAQRVEPYASSVEFVRRLRSVGVRFALISASRNAKTVLKAAGLDGLFDVIVDGIDAVELGLRGKPAPDIFLEAARRLEVPPERAAVVEDALAGVEAGRAGGFGAVIGVDRTGLGNELKEHGADIVVSELTDLLDRMARGRPSHLPSALDSFEDIFRRLRAGVPAVLLDYDGTLTPIVLRPSMAVLSPEMGGTLTRLSKNCLVAIVSGRDLKDVQAMVGLPHLVYIGSHGFELSGLDGSIKVHEQGKPFLPALDAAEAELRSSVEGTRGAWVERKRFAIALHYREVAPEDVPEVERRFDGVAQRHPDLRRMSGKKVFELQPNLDWDKGKAVLALLDTFHVDGSVVVPLYIGDDLTDEDAFRAVAGRGIAILVSDKDRDTAAGYVLRNVAEVHAFLERLVDLFESETAGGTWSLRYDGFEAEKERLRETLCTTGNGYMASRGAAPESPAGEFHYPGNYIAGIYNRRVSSVAGKMVENESMVNIPNWLTFSFNIDGEEKIDLSTIEPANYHQELDMRRGTFKRMVSFTDQQGRRTSIIQRKLVSMHDPHIAALETSITPENWSGTIRALSALDGNVDNTMVKRYLPLDNHHLNTVGTGTTGKDVIWLQAETNQSLIRITEAARTRVYDHVGMTSPEASPITRPGFIGLEIDVPVTSGLPTRIEKIVAIYSSKDRGISESKFEALHALVEAPDFGQLLEMHQSSWHGLWDRCHIKVDAEHENIAQVLNLHIFHLLQTVSGHTIDLDAGVPPRGLHGEAYRGLIMWDEIFIFPFLNLRVPDLTRSLLLYRYRRLPWARWAAVQERLKGAMYPWQSGSDGKQEAQTIHLNPLSGEWIPDLSYLERHIGLAVGYNVWQYYQVTGDSDFMSFYGTRMMIEIARFWASKARFNPDRRRYEILGVMGPDEFHEKYPDRTEPGMDNNAYTNVLAAWLLCRTLDAIDMLPSERRQDLLENMAVSAEEMGLWEDISRRMFVPMHGDGIISQFEGYDQLKELDWERYRNQYGNIHRLDRILKAEGDSPNRYKVSKQADVLMLFYLFSSDELKELFDRLGYAWDPEMITRTIDYYMVRTSHGSTLSRVVHAWVLSRINRERSWTLFLEALRSDISDIQGGTTAEGIHLGAMAGTVDIVQRCYSGLETRGDVLWFNPALPAGLRRLEFDLEYRRHRICVEIDSGKLRLTSRPQDIAPISIGFRGKVLTLAPGVTIELDLA